MIDPPLNLRIAAVILAAGRGSRLSPITNELPKPLLNVGADPLIDLAIEKAKQAGAEQVFVNAFHAAPALFQYLDGVDGVLVREELRLSGPAGALRIFEPELRTFDRVLVISGDALFDGDLRPLVDDFGALGEALTIATCETDHAYRFGVLRVSDDEIVLSAEEKPDIPASERRRVSAGIYCLRPSVIPLLPSNGIADFITDLLPALMRKGIPVRAWQLKGEWSDIGTFTSLYRANMRAALGAPNGRVINPTASIAPTAQLVGGIVVGAGATIGPGATLVDSVVLDGAVVHPGQVVIGGIISKETVNNENC